MTLLKPKACIATGIRGSILVTPTPGQQIKYKEDSKSLRRLGASNSTHLTQHKMKYLLIY